MERLWAGVNYRFVNGRINAETPADVMSFGGVFGFLEKGRGLFGTGLSGCRVWFLGDGEPREFGLTTSKTSFYRGSTHFKNQLPATNQVEM